MKLSCFANSKSDKGNVENFRFDLKNVLVMKLYTSNLIFDDNFIFIKYLGQI